jgi:hypothetical protein
MFSEKKPRELRSLDHYFAEKTQHPEEANIFSVDESGISTVHKPERILDPKGQK